MTAELTQIAKENGEKIQHIREDVTLVLFRVSDIQESLDDLVDVPNKLDVLGVDTKAIMTDLVTTRKEHITANNRLTDALIRLLYVVAMGFFIIVLLCLAGYYGRDLNMGKGDMSGSFTQTKQEKTEVTK